MAKIGVIGGSGLYEIEGISDLKGETIKTPFGSPSDEFMIGTLEGVEVVFLPRHGKGHRYAPSQINYRANIYGMKKFGVDAIFSVSACGSLKEELKPLDFVVPDQFLDRTNKMRETSFFTEGIVAHVAFADPVSSELTAILIESAKEAGVTVHEKGTYVNMEGPQFSTKAESNLYRSWGMDVIASILFSATTSVSPICENIRQAVLTSLLFALLPLHTAVTAAPTCAGKFGIVRITRTLFPNRFSINSVVIPAAIEITSAFRLITPFAHLRTPSNSCGLTAKIMMLFCLNSCSKSWSESLYFFFRVCARLLSCSQTRTSYLLRMPAMIAEPIFPPPMIATFCLLTVKNRPSYTDHI